MNAYAIINNAMKTGRPVHIGTLRRNTAGPRGLAEAVETAARLGVTVIGRSCYGERLEQERLPRRPS